MGDQLISQGSDGGGVVVLSIKGRKFSQGHMASPGKARRAWVSIGHS